MADHGLTRNAFHRLNWLDEIDKGIQRCRAAFVFVGSNGLGEIQDQVEAKQLFIKMLEREIPLVPILMDALDKPTGLLRTYQGVAYETASQADWIRSFVTDRLQGKTKATVK